MKLSSLDENLNFKKIIEKASESLNVKSKYNLKKYSIREGNSCILSGKELNFFMTESKAKREAESIINECPNKKIWISVIENGEIIKNLFFEGLDWVSEEEFKSKTKLTYTVDKEISNDIKTIIEKFLEYSKEFLKLDSLPEITFLSKREGKMTGGVYDPEAQTIKVLMGNRCLADVLRSTAHELVHHQQNVQKRIPSEPIPEVGGDIEDEANSVGGQIIKSFCKKDDNNLAYDVYIK